MKIHRKNGRGKSYIVSGRDQNNETFCLPKNKKQSISMKQKKIIVWRTKMVQKVKKSWKRMFSISVDQEREKDEVKPKRRMPENSNSEVYVFFN